MIVLRTSDLVKMFFLEIRRPHTKNMQRHYYNVYTSGWGSRRSLTRSRGLCDWSRVGLSALWWRLCGLWAGVDGGISTLMTARPSCWWHLSVTWPPARCWLVDLSLAAWQRWAMDDAILHSSLSLYITLRAVHNAYDTCITCINCQLHRSRISGRTAMA